MGSSPYREPGEGALPEPEIVFTAGYFFPLEWLRAVFAIEGDNLTVTFHDTNGGAVFARIEAAPAGLHTGTRFYVLSGPLEARHGYNVPRLTQTLFSAYEFIATKLGFDPLTGRRPRA